MRASVKTRGLATVAVLCWLSACSATRTLVLPGETGLTAATLAAMLAARPLADGQNIRADLVASSSALSTHLIQVRNREAPHLHAQHDLVVTLLRGQGTLHAANRAFPMRAGDAASVPRGTVHYFVNGGSAPAVALATFAPPHDGTDQVPAP